MNVRFHIDMSQSFRIISEIKYLLSRQKFSVIFLNLPKRMTGWYTKICHDSFVPRSSHFICCGDSATSNVIYRGLVK